MFNTMKKKRFYSLRKFALFVLLPLIFSSKLTAQATGSGKVIFNTSDGLEHQIDVTVADLFNNVDNIYTFSGVTNKEIDFGPFNLDGVLSINQIDLSTNTKVIFGNPKSELNVYFLFNGEKTISAKVYDVQGRLVSIPIVNYKSNFVHIYDQLLYVKPGVYFVKIQGVKNGTVKFIKKHANDESSKPDFNKNGIFNLKSFQGTPNYNFSWTGENIVTGNIDLEVIEGLNNSLNISVDLIEQEFDNIEAIDWFFYHNTLERSSNTIQSVMTSKDSINIIETYADVDNVTKFMLLKSTKENDLGIFEILENNPLKYYITDIDVGAKPDFSFLFNENYIELYYHNYDYNVKILLTKFNIIENDFGIDFIDYFENSNKKIGSSKKNNECDLDIVGYDGEEACILLAREYWCNKYSNWKIKIPIFVAEKIAERASPIGAFAKRVAAKTRGLLGPFNSLSQEAFEFGIEKITNMYIEDTSLKFNGSLNSFIFNNLYKEEIINGFCRTYGYEINEDNYLVNINGQNEQQEINIDFNNSYAESVRLERSSDSIIVGWLNEDLPKPFKSIIKQIDNREIPSNVKFNIVWRIEDLNRPINETTIVQSMNINEDKEFFPLIPNETGEYIVRASLVEKPNDILEFRLVVSENDYEIIIHNVNPYGFNSTPNVNTLEVDFTIYSKKGRNSLGLIYIRVANWLCCPNNNFTSINILNDNPNSKYLNCEFRESFYDQPNPVTLDRICVNIFEPNPLCKNY